MKKRILLIDDERDIREMLGQALRTQGYEIFAAASGAEGKRLALEKTPDLIISDLQLEDADGLDIIEEIKKSKPDMPVILLTGVIFDPETVRATLKRNVTAYLEKTASLRKILAEIVRICPPEV